ncbi:MAG: GTP-binding protein [Spirochaetota bacterium]
MSSTSERTRLMIIGGFLGAGKTTTILRLAELLQANGMRFGIVTNDQGSDLVDTHFLRAHGLVVNEVTGGCFCCNFDQFAAALGSYREQADVVLAEPVGSCTDLVATLFRPLRAEQTSRFEIAPLSVVIDPRRARRFLASTGSPEINYLFEKQAEEADILLLNKTDSLSPDESRALRSQLEERFPGRPVLEISARDGTGLDELMHLSGTAEHRDRALTISYDRYGESEAALGWLNLRAILPSPSANGAPAERDGNALATALLDGIAGAARDAEWEIAHAKLYLVSGLDYAKASLTETEGTPSLDERMNTRGGTLELVLNARVAADPDELTETVHDVIARLVPEVEFQTESAFRPSYPTPTHRIVS